MRRLNAAETEALPSGLVRAVPIEHVWLKDREHPVSGLRRLLGLEPVIVVRGRQIFWPGLPADLSTTSQNLSLLAHELTHVWQYENGMTLLGYLWRERGRYAYDVGPFDTLGYEQQAAMVEDWVRLRCGIDVRYSCSPVDRAALEVLIPFA